MNYTLINLAGVAVYFRILNEFVQKIPQFEERKDQKELQVCLEFYFYINSDPNPHNNPLIYYLECIFYIPVYV